MKCNRSYMKHPEIITEANQTNRRYRREMAKKQKAEKGKRPPQQTDHVSETPEEPSVK